MQSLRERIQVGLDREGNLEDAGRNGPGAARVRRCWTTTVSGTRWNIGFSNLRVSTKTARGREASKNRRDLYSRINGTLLMAYARAGSLSPGNKVALVRHSAGRPGAGVPQRQRRGRGEDARVWGVFGSQQAGVGERVGSIRVMGKRQRWGCLLGVMAPAAAGVVMVAPLPVLPEALSAHPHQCFQDGHSVLSCVLP